MVFRDSLRSYSRFVHVSKFTLSLMIIVILVFMVAVPLLNRQDNGIRVAFATIEEKEDAPPVMVNPKFQGVDSQNRPYLVTANRAVQSGEHVIVLENVAADLTTESGAWLALIARQGTLDMEEESLLLQGNVQLYHDAGHEMQTEQVRVDLGNLNAFGESPVQIQGEFGHIKSNRFTILDKGDRMLFNDEVFVLLLP